MTPGLRGWADQRFGLLMCCALTFVAAIQGCASLPATGTSSQTEALGEWRGRFSLTLVAPQGSDTEEQFNEERAQGRFELSKTRGQLQLALFSPFGQKMANAVANDRGASLTTSQGQTYSAATTNELVRQALGWRLPVDSLPGWLSGTNLSRDSDWVERDGWLVRVEKRLRSGKPRILSANWPTQPSADKHQLKLLVVVDGG